MEEIKVRRYSSFRIIEHLLAIILFSILILTGLSQKFYTFSLSERFIFYLGGIDSVRIIHRYTGLIFAVFTVVHLITGMIIIYRGGGRDIMITRKDFDDIIQNLRYYIGMEHLPALCGRYTYKQKFEYWGIITGTMLMVMSGLILRFPSQSTDFFSGQCIPIAKMIHTNHAVVMSIIVSWHIYNSIFSPGVFPFNRSIFTGYISRSRMVREHPLELATMEGKTVDEILEELRDKVSTGERSI